MSPEPPIAAVQSKGVITIFQTRYGGAYEGGPWAAVWASPQDIPEDAIVGDTFASRWWQEHEAEVGVGSTPDEALADLKGKRSIELQHG
jgi:hypothetical protein